MGLRAHKPENFIRLNAPLNSEESTPDNSENYTWGGIDPDGQENLRFPDHSNSRLRSKAAVQLLARLGLFSYR